MSIVIIERMFASIVIDNNRNNDWTMCAKKLMF